MNLIVSQINNTLIKEEFYNKIMQEWWDDNEGNSVITETFIEIITKDWLLLNADYSSLIKKGWDKS